MTDFLLYNQFAEIRTFFSFISSLVFREAPDRLCTITLIFTSKDFTAPLINLL